MLINEKKDFQINEHELFLEGVLCINSSQWLPAYSIFKRLTEAAKNPSVPTLYNMALCCFYSREYLQSVSILNEAINGMVGISSASKQAGPSPEVLLSHEYDNNFHHLALTENILNLNASLVKLRIRRLMVDANQEMGNWDEVIRLSNLPEMNKCKNVTQALAIANTKTTD